MLDELADLLVGARCPGCSRPGLGLCPPCRAAVGVPARPLDDAVSLGPVLTGRSASAGRWEGPVRRLVTAFKDRGSWGLAGVLGHQLALAVLWVLRTAQEQGRYPSAGGVVLVPVPSSPRAVRARGFDHSRVLARTAARLVSARASPGSGVGVALPLRRVRVVADQSGLGRAQRLVNQRGTMRARAPSGCRTAIVVDDVCTTGASLSEAARALNEAGWTVLGAAVVAHPSRPGPGRTVDSQIFLEEPLKRV